MPVYPNQPGTEFTIWWLVMHNQPITSTCFRFSPTFSSLPFFSTAAQSALNAGRLKLALLVPDVPFRIRYRVEVPPSPPGFPIIIIDIIGFVLANFFFFVYCTVFQSSRSLVFPQCPRSVSIFYYSPVLDGVASFHLPIYLTFLNSSKELYRANKPLSKTISPILFRKS